MSLAFAASTFCQDYYQKAKNQKTTAWVLVAVGSAMLITGIVSASNTFENSNFLLNDKDGSKIKASGILLLTGFACDITSIPFFISALKNQKLAGEVFFNNQKILLPQNGFVVAKYQPGLTVKINL